MKKEIKQEILDRIQKEIDRENSEYTLLSNKDYVGRGISLGKVNGLLTAKIIIQELTIEDQIMIKARLVKDDKTVKEIYNIKNVVANKKYGYFEITEKIYKHEIITIHRFKDVEKVELYQTDILSGRFNKTPYKVVERE